MRGRGGQGPPAGRVAGVTDAPTDDHEFAAWLADRAGDRLLEVRATSGLSGRDLKDAGDAAA